MVKRFRALLIANGVFAEGAGLAQLQGPAKDVEILRSALIDPEIGLHAADNVRVVVDGSKAEVMDALNSVLEEASKDEQVLIYFSGHGVLDLSDDLFLCSRDTDKSKLKPTAIWAGEIKSWLAKTRAPSVVMILDCCYAGAFQAKGDSEPTRQFDTEGVFVLSSSKSNQLSADGPEGSVFTRLLVESLSNAVDSDQDGHISLDEAFTYLRPRLKGHATPTMSVVHGTSYPPLVKARAYDSPPENLVPRQKKKRREETRAETGTPALPIPLSPEGKLAFIAATLPFNCLIAAVSSLTLGFPIPYWPAYLVGILITVYFGWPGFLVAVLGPLVTNVIFQEVHVFLYLPSNVLQNLAVLAVVRLGRINPLLAGWPDRVKFLSLGVAIPSAICGALAWWLRTQAGPVGPYFPTFAMWTLRWTIENVLPAAIPGFWLFRLIGESYQPFAWGRGRAAAGWIRRSVQVSGPWLVSLFALGVFLILVALELTGSRPVEDPARALEQATMTPWDRFSDIVGAHSALQLMAFAFLVCTLFSIGSSVKHAKQSWALMEAVRRHFPNRRIGELLANAQTSPTEQCAVTVLICDVHGFTERSTRMAPVALMEWLNRYFARMCAVAERHGGMVEKLMGDSVTVVFGLEANDARPINAIRCALDMVEEARGLDEESAAMGPCSLGIGVCTGIVVAGDVGSAERRQYTIIGNAVTIAHALEKKTADLPDDALPILLSRETLRHSGVMANENRSAFLVDWPIRIEGHTEREAYAPKRNKVSRLREELEEILPSSGEQ